MGNESVPTQLAQCRFPGLAISNAKILIYFSKKYREAILPNSTRKLLWFEITKMLTAVQEKKNKFLCHLITIFGTLVITICPIRPIMCKYDVIHKMESTRPRQGYCARPQATCTNNVVKIGRAVPEICLLADKLTDKQTC